MRTVSRPIKWGVIIQPFDDTDAAIHCVMDSGKFNPYVSRMCFVTSNVGAWSHALDMHKL